MPVYDAKFSLPDVAINKSRAEIEIRLDGKKLGTLTVSHASIDWARGNGKTVKRLNWKKFAEFMAQLPIESTPKRSMKKK